MCEDFLTVNSRHSPSRPLGSINSMRLLVEIKSSQKGRTGTAEVTYLCVSW